MPRPMFFWRNFCCVSWLRGGSRVKKTLTTDVLSLHTPKLKTYYIFSRTKSNQSSLYFSVELNSEPVLCPDQSFFDTIFAVLLCWGVVRVKKTLTTDVLSLHTPKQLTFYIFSRTKSNQSCLYLSVELNYERVLCTDQCFFDAIFAVLFGWGVVSELKRHLPPMYYRSICQNCEHFIFFLAQSWTKVVSTCL